MADMESHISKAGFPRSAQDVQAAYHNARVHNTVSPSTVDKVTAYGESQGFGNTFEISSKPKTDVKEQLERVQDQIAEQTEKLEREAKIREGGFGK